MARAGGYCGAEFKGYRGVTQGDPLYTTIFNVVVDAVVTHWLTGVISDAEKQGERVKEGRHQAALFYVENSMVASSAPHWLQGDFNTLVGLFDRLGLRTNVRKKVGMVCHPYQAARNLSEAAYKRRVMGKGPTYRDCLKGQVSCRECGDLMVAGSMIIHIITQHKRVMNTRRRWRTPATGAVPKTFRMVFPVKGGLRSCPVEGYPGRVAKRTAMRVHFLQLHVLDTVVILEEGNHPTHGAPNVTCWFHGGP